MAAGLSDLIKSLNLNKLEEALDHYAEHEEKSAFLQEFETACLATAPEDAVKMGEEDEEKLALLQTFYMHRTYCSYDPNNEAIREKLASLMSVQAAIGANNDSKTIADNVPLASASQSTWNLGVTTAQTLREIIISSMTTHAKQGKINKEKLAKLLPRILTPNQTYSDDINVLKKDYAGRIPQAILQVLNSLHDEVVSLASNAEMKTPEQIKQIIAVYEGYVETIRSKTNDLLNAVTQGDFFNVLHKIIGLTDKEKEELTDDKIRELLVNSYRLMCFQYICPIIQDTLKKQGHEDKEVISSCIPRILLSDNYLCRSATIKIAG